MKTASFVVYVVKKLPLDKIEHLKIEFEKRREEHNKANSIAKEK